MINKELISDAIKFHKAFGIDLHVCVNLMLHIEKSDSKIELNTLNTLGWMGVLDFKVIVLIFGGDELIKDTSNERDEY